MRALIGVFAAGCLPVLPHSPVHQVSLGLASHILKRRFMRKVIFTDPQFFNYIHGQGFIINRNTSQ